MKEDKKTSYDTCFHLIRRFIVFSVIIVFSSLALFWETLPASIKNTVSYLASTRFDNSDSGMIPRKYRIEYYSLDPGVKNLKPQNSEIQTGSMKDIGTDMQAPSPMSVEHHDFLDGIAREQLQRELKELGVTSCQLCYWGNSKNMLRFSCQVPLSECNPSATRTFQSISPDANQSIKDVVGQIKQWRTTIGERK